MLKEIIYLKETNSYDDILKKEHKGVHIFLKKLIYIYKNIFNIVTKKRVEDKKIWVLPIKEKYSLNKLEKILQKKFKCKENIFLVSNKLKESKICLIMDKLNIEYIKEEKIKTVLIFKALEYIVKLQNKEMCDLEITVLVNNTSELNLYILEELAKQVKIIKIVSLNIYKLKKLEEKLYNEHGIPIQFSNSYRKSLEKSKLIINLDFNEIEINEYEIFNKAIIINCIKDDITINSKLFNGLTINSLDIEYDEELVNQFKKVKLYENYTKLMLYSSVIEKEESIYRVLDKIQKDGVYISEIMGKRGKIDKREIIEKAKVLFL